jgi:hypothetical protein
LGFQVFFHPKTLHLQFIVFKLLFISALLPPNLGDVATWMAWCAWGAWGRAWGTWASLPWLFHPWRPLLLRIDF